MNRADMENTVTAAPVREGLAPNSEYIVVNTEIYADRDGNVVSRYDPAAVRTLAGPGGVIERSFAERWGITGTLYVEGEPQPVVGALNTTTPRGVIRDSADEQGEEAISNEVLSALPFSGEAEVATTDVERPLGAQLVEEKEGEVVQVGQERTPRKYRK